jgi:dinuclear metal center YbgI/SA1388 family protein
VKVRDICEAMDELAPPCLAYEGDRIGLSIGDPEWEVTRAAIALTVTPEVAKTAIRKRVDLMVSHHPVIWEPLRALRTDNEHTRMCLALAEARVACFAAHTNLDVVPGGVNDRLAQLLCLINCRPLFPVAQRGLVKLVTFVPKPHVAAVRDAVCRAGAGVIGEYTHCTFSAPGVGTFLPSEEANPFSGEKRRVNEEPERRFETLVSEHQLGKVIQALLQAHPYEEVAYDIIPLANKDPRVGIGVCGELRKSRTLRAFAEHTRTALELSAVRVVGDPNKRVSKVAVLGGSGGSRVREIPPRIDVYVTGDVTYHDALAARERGLAVIDAGHAGTEKCIVPVVAGFLRKRFRSLRMTTLDEPDVFHLG